MHNLEYTRSEASLIGIAGAILGATVVALVAAWKAPRYEPPKVIQLESPGPDLRLPTGCNVLGDPGTIQHSSIVTVYCDTDAAANELLLMTDE